MLIDLGRKKADIPVYSFEKHARQSKTTTIYSPHVLILEGIFALHDQRVLDMLDLKIFTEAESDLCLSRRRTPSDHIFNTTRELTRIARKSSAMFVSEVETSKAASSNGLDL
jgi:uridine kinase